MSKTPVGQIRINPHTLTTEMWDGKSWVDQYYSGLTNNNPNTTYVSHVKPSLSFTERELIFDFLKQNMRVAEYVDNTGKVLAVQLEMRAGEGFVWEQIRREKVKNSL